MLWCLRLVGMTSGVYRFTEDGDSSSGSIVRAVLVSKAEADDFFFMLLRSAAEQVASEGRCSVMLKRCRRILLNAAGENLARATSIPLLALERASLGSE